MIPGTWLWEYLVLQHLDVQISTCVTHLGYLLCGPETFIYRVWAHGSTPVFFLSDAVKIMVEPLCLVGRSDPTSQGWARRAEVCQWSSLVPSKMELDWEDWNEHEQNTPACSLVWERHINTCECLHGATGTFQAICTQQLDGQYLTCCSCWYSKSSQEIDHRGSKVMVLCMDDSVMQGRKAMFLLVH